MKPCCFSFTLDLQSACFFQHIPPIIVGSIQLCKCEIGAAQACARPSPSTIVYLSCWHYMYSTEIFEDRHAFPNKLILNGADIALYAGLLHCLKFDQTGLRPMLVICKRLCMTIQLQFLLEPQQKFSSDEGCPEKEVADMSPDHQLMGTSTRLKRYA